MLLDAFLAITGGQTDRHVASCEWLLDLVGSCLLISHTLSAALLVNCALALHVILRFLFYLLYCHIDGNNDVPCN